MSSITPNIYIGSINEAKNKFWLKQHGITHIVNASIEIPNYFPNNFTYLRLNLFDIPQQKIYQALEPSYRFMDNAISKEGKVLVHCHAGVSRSTSIVLYYLMKKDKMSLPEALNYVKVRRPRVNPNQGFIKQLNSLTFPSRRNNFV